MADCIESGPRDLQFLTAEQAAILLQVSSKSICRWAAADPSMPALRIGRTLRFDRERLLQWLRTKTQGFGRPKAQKRAHEEGEHYASA
jgi:excisionase family DNA binding protein